MVHRRHLAILLALFLAIAAGGRCAAQDQGNCPCGPQWLGPLRALIPQGCGGGDYRPACREHDDCYTTPGMPRSVCDEQFRANMHCACENSSVPGLCRLTAELQYLGVRLFGGSSYRRLQAKASREQWSPCGCPCQCPCDGNP